MAHCNTRAAREADLAQFDSVIELAWVPTGTRTPAKSKMTAGKKLKGTYVVLKVRRQNKSHSNNYCHN
jgi:hypothetical protein